MERQDTPRFDDPIGRIRDAEHFAERELLAWLASGHLGVRGGGLYGALSTGLDILAAASSCRWGCRGGGHGLENVLRRLVNGSLAAIKLGFTGYYDEAMALVRVCAENANILQLFVKRTGALEAWETADETERRRSFSPVRVRRTMDLMGCAPIYDAAAYSALCEDVHITPASSRQSHDLEGVRLFVGPVASVPGLMLIWTELAVGIAGCLPVVLEIVPVPAEIRVSAGDAANALVAAIGRGENARSKLRIDADVVPIPTHRPRVSGIRRCFSGLAQLTNGRSDMYRPG
jgi:hypothetical protein